MTAIVILNIVFAAIVLGGMIALLSRAIIADNPELRSGRPLALDRRPARQRTRGNRSANRVTARVEMDPVA
jgi:hypothetical protein